MTIGGLLRGAIQCRLLIEELLSRFHHMLLEPGFVLRHPPLHNDMKTIEDGPNPIQICSCAKLIWSGHHLKFE